MQTIPHFLQISETLFTGGMPLPGQLKSIQAAGVFGVINLAMSDSPNAIADEGTQVNSLGMCYTHIPVIWTMPLISDLTRFFDQMDAWKGKPLFVHCVLNMRVSIFVYLYRVLRNGEPAGSAYMDVLRIWQPDEVWQSFMQEAMRSLSDLPDKK